MRPCPCPPGPPRPRCRCTCSTPRSRAVAPRRWRTSPPGCGRWRLPAALARLDIRNRYRGSVLGPFWLTLSTAVMVVGLGLLYSSLFKMALADYLPFLAVSLIVWNTINQIVTDACTSLTSAEGIIRQMPAALLRARAALRLPQRPHRRAQPAADPRGLPRLRHHAGAGGAAGRSPACADRGERLRRRAASSACSAPASATSRRSSAA